MKRSTNKQVVVNCYCCSEPIDKSSCNIEYAVLTLIDNRPSPIKKVRRYICSECIELVSYKLDILSLFDK